MITKQTENSCRVKTNEEKKMKLQNIREIQEKRKAQKSPLERSSSIYTSNLPLRNLKRRIQATHNTLHHRALRPPPLPLSFPPSSKIAAPATLPKLSTPSVSSSGCAPIAGLKLDPERTGRRRAIANAIVPCSCPCVLGCEGWI